MVWSRLMAAPPGLEPGRARTGDLGDTRPRLVRPQGSALTRSRRRSGRRWLRGGWRSSSPTRSTRRALHKDRCRHRRSDDRKHVGCVDTL